MSEPPANTALSLTATTGGAVPRGIWRMPVPSVRRNPPIESVTPNVLSVYVPPWMIRLPANVVPLDVRVPPVSRTLFHARTGAGVDEMEPRTPPKLKLLALRMTAVSGLIRTKLPPMKVLSSTQVPASARNGRRIAWECTRRMPASGSLTASAALLTSTDVPASTAESWTCTFDSRRTVSATVPLKVTSWKKLVHRVGELDGLDAGARAAEPHRVGAAGREHAAGPRLDEVARRP